MLIAIQNFLRFIPFILTTSLFGCWEEGPMPANWYDDADVDTDTGQETMPDGIPEVSDPDATYETRALFGNLEALSRDHILFGHQFTTHEGQDWVAETFDERSDVLTSTGDYPAVHGFDFGRGIGLFRDHVLAVYARGGVITFSWHADNPVTGNTYSDTEGHPMTEILPGGSANQTWLGWLDDIADFLSDLTLDGVQAPIIFRPFHEDTGDWFWWGVGNADGDLYREVWQYTVDYLREERAVHNMLLAYSPSRPSQGVDWTERYPGDDHVDIVGFDRYEPIDYSDVLTMDAREMVAFAQARGKISAITETGVSGGIGGDPVEDWFISELLDPIKSDPLAKHVAWVLKWRQESDTVYWVPLPGQPHYDGFLDFYNDPFTLFESDLPNMYEW